MLGTMVAAMLGPELGTMVAAMLGTELGSVVAAMLGPELGTVVAAMLGPELGSMRISVVISVGGLVVSMMTEVARPLSEGYGSGDEDDDSGD